MMFTGIGSRISHLAPRDLEPDQDTQSGRNVPESALPGPLGAGAASIEERSTTPSFRHAGQQRGQRMTVPTMSSADFAWPGANPA